MMSGVHLDDGEEPVVVVMMMMMIAMMGAEWTMDCSNVPYFNVYTCSYEIPDIALLTGSMLRECIKHEALAKELLWSKDFYRLFSYVDLQNFEVAADAFVTFRVRINEWHTYTQVA